MTTPGNDPFSGTNTRDILQHVISPKVVSDGSTGYAVKTDLINVDNAYERNTYYKLDNGTVIGQVGAYAASLNINTNSQIRFGRTDAQLTDTGLVVGVVGTKTDVLTVGGTVDARQDTQPAGTNHFRMTNASGTTRWGIGMQTAETGANSGGDFSIYAYDDSGAFITRPIYITRATGIVNTAAGFYGKSKGTVTLVGGTATVSNTNVTADSDILLTLKTKAGTGTGNAYVSAKVASTSFTVTSVAGAEDISTFNYIILN